MNSWRSVPQGRAYSTLRVPAPEMQKQLRGDLSCKASAQNWKGWLKPPLATDWVQFPRLRDQHSLLRSGCWTLGSDVLLDETTREPQLKRNLMENWRNAQFLCQQDLESTDPHLNYEVGCELTSWVEYPWDDGSAQWLVPCCETRDPVSGTPFILRCIKWQKKYLRDTDNVLQWKTWKSLLCVGEKRCCEVVWLYRWNIFINSSSRDLLVNNTEV